MEGIVSTKDVLGGEPRLAERRIAVRQIAGLVINGANPPAEIADQLDIPISEVHLALAYYYKNPEEMADVQKQHREAAERAKQEALEPPEAVKD
ncbi:DUF433 domain-containing protein [Halobacteriaceae bacterium SHR40]|uniref:DUF433 domain-containing protein n=1 Tax=Halovenus amylolytica TaxID=2500550 RepID=UPI000FE3C2CC